MMKNNFSRILLGVGFIAAAVLLVVDQLQLFDFQIGFTTIIFTVIFAALFIKGLFDRSIYLSVFSLAFLAILYSKKLHFASMLSPMMILFVALLVSIGLSLLFTKSIKPKVVINGDIGENTIDENSDDIVIDYRMGDTSRYVHSQHLKSITINASMGDVNVYLDDAQAAGDRVNVNMSASMGDVDFFIPLSWQVENHLNATLGDITVKGKSNGGGPTLVLRGKANMGDVTINYI